MNILIMGAPGAGKGTMSEKIVRDFGLMHISTGDIFRSEIKNQTELGLLAKSYMDQGLLVPDEVTNPMVVAYLKKLDLSKGYLLDGYPRTKEQAKAFNDLVMDTDLEVDVVLNLEVDFDIITERITGRRISPTSGAIYHIKYNPPKVDGICDIDGKPLIQRADDTLESITVRLKVYDEQTKPVLFVYEELNKVVQIDANQTSDKVYSDIVTVLESIND